MSETSLSYTFTMNQFEGGHCPTVELFNETIESETCELKSLNARLKNYMDKTRDSGDSQMKLIEEYTEAMRNMTDQYKRVQTQEEVIYGNQVNRLNDIQMEIFKNRLDNGRIGRMNSLMEERISEYNVWNKKDDGKISKNDELLQNAQRKISVLEKNLKSLNSEIADNANKFKMLSSELENAEMDLIDQSVQRADSKNKNQSLCEKMEMENEIHKIERNIMTEIVDISFRDSPGTSADLQDCIDRIKAVFEDLLEREKLKLNSQYETQVQSERGLTLQSGRPPMNRNAMDKLEIMNDRCQSDIEEMNNKNSQLRERNAELQSKIREMEDKMNQMREERTLLAEEIQRHFQPQIDSINSLTNFNDSLKLQLMSYEELLRIEEARLDSKNNKREQKSEAVMKKPREVVEQEQSEMVESFLQETINAPLMSSRRPDRSSYDSTAYGRVAIQTVQEDGDCIRIENSVGGKNESLSGWKIVQRVDKTSYTYTFSQFYLGPGKSVTVWNRKSRLGPEDKENLIWSSKPDFSNPEKIETYLLDQTGNPRAKFILNFIPQIN